MRIPDGARFTTPEGEVVRADFGAGSSLTISWQPLSDRDRLDDLVRHDLDEHGEIVRDVDLTEELFQLHAAMPDGGVTMARTAALPGLGVVFTCSVAAGAPEADRTTCHDVLASVDTSVRTRGGAVTRVW